MKEREASLAAEKNPNNLPMTREDLEDNKDMRNLRILIMKQLYRQDKDGHYVYDPTQQFSTFDKQGGKVAVLSGGRIDRQKIQWSSTELERLGTSAIPDETEKAAKNLKKIVVFAALKFPLCGSPKARSIPD